MDHTQIFTPKAEIYDQYRWGYSPEAVKTIMKTVGVSMQTTIVDLGAGTGILSKHFIGKTGQLILVEPNAGMRRVSARLISGQEGCQIVPERAEATGLPDQCADLVTAAQAIHWFDPESVRKEIARILKPDGWLAVLRNDGADEMLNTAIEDVYSEENGCDPNIITNRPAWKPMEYFYGDGHFHRSVFPFVEKMTRERFIGALSTASYAPNADHPLYSQFAKIAGEVFDSFSHDGILSNPVKTELYLGQISTSSQTIS